MIKLLVMSALFAGAMIPAAMAASQQPSVDRGSNVAVKANGRLVVEKARAFLATLTPDQLSEVVVPYSFRQHPTGPTCRRPICGAVDRGSRPAR